MRIYTQEKSSIKNYFKNLFEPKSNKRWDNTPEKKAIPLQKILNLEAGKIWKAIAEAIAVTKKRNRTL